MNDYTVVFDHPHEHTPEYVHIKTIDTRHAHLMFFGKLANEWDYGWENMRFDKQTNLSRAHGAIMVKWQITGFTGQDIDLSNTLRFTELLQTWNDFAIH